jgi:hypothetical protein
MSAPADRVSIRQFAKLDGCDDKLVRRAITQGKLPKSEDGKLDPALAGTGWRKRNRNRPADADSAPIVRTPRTTAAKSAPSADEVESAADNLFAEEAEDFLTKVLEGHFADQAHAERIKENALAAKHLLAARKEAGNLVEIEAAEKILFDTQRSQRDAWLNFPTRIGPVLAAELGVEADKVVEAITAHVQQQLEDLGEPDADFTQPSQG